MLFFSLSKTLDVLLSPLTWALALWLFSVPWRRKPRSRAQVALGLSGFFVLFVFSLPLVSGLLENATEQSAHDTRRPGQVYDAVIILGGALDGATSPIAGQTGWNENVERLMVGYEVLARGEARYAIVTGAQVGGSGSDAIAMRNQLIAWGIAPSRVLLQERSLNTYQDALYTRPIVEAQGFEQLLLITSAFHVLRAEECFFAQGMVVDVLPVDFRSGRLGANNWTPRAAHLSDSTRMLRELAGRVIYRVQGYAKPRPIGGQ